MSANSGALVHVQGMRGLIHVQGCEGDITPSLPCCLRSLSLGPMKQKEKLSVIKDKEDEDEYKDLVSLKRPDLRNSTHVQR